MNYPNFYIDIEGSTELMKKWMAEAERYTIKDRNLDQVFEQIRKSLSENPAPRMIIIDSFSGSVK